MNFSYASIFFTRKWGPESVFSDDDDVFYPYAVTGHQHETSPEFFEVNSAHSGSHRNSLCSISEIEDEEVAINRLLQLAPRRRTLSLEQDMDPRYELFCKWLEFQGGPVQSTSYERIGVEDDGSSDEFHDAAERNDGISVKDLAMDREVASEPAAEQKTVPIIMEPKPRPDMLRELHVDCEPKEWTPKVMLPKKLHSPKKGRAPVPPSPSNFSRSSDSLSDTASLHKETTI